MMSDNPPEPNFLSLTARIVAAHLEHNPTPADALPALIEDVFRTLRTLAIGSAPAAIPSDKPQPAVPVKRSVFPDYLICLEDGKRMKMLKGHLRTSYGMTPDEYRARWKLPADYPMTAPAYKQKRSEIARGMSLGHWRKKQVVEPVQPVVTLLRARRAKGSRG